MKVSITNVVQMKSYDILGELAFWSMNMYMYACIYTGAVDIQTTRLCACEYFYMRVCLCDWLIAYR